MVVSLLEQKLEKRFMPHSMPDLEPEQVFIHNNFADRMVPGGVPNFVNPMQPLTSGPRNSDLGFQQFGSQSDGIPFYNHQYDNAQLYHHISNHDTGAVPPPPNFYRPYILPPATSSVLNIPQHFGSPEILPSSSNLASGVNLGGCFGRDNFLTENTRGPFKRKNAEALHENFAHLNGPVGSSVPSSHQFQNAAPLRWDVAAFGPPEYPGSSSLSVTEGSDRVVRCRPAAVAIQPECALANYHNHLHDMNMNEPFQATNSTWMIEFENNVSDASVYNWNGVSTNGYVQGVLESTDVGMQTFSDASSTTSSSFALHPASLPIHQNLSPVQAMQILNYGHRTQVPGSYRYPVQRNTTNASFNHLVSHPRFPVLRPGTDMVLRPPRQLAQHAREVNQANLRILSSDDAFFEHTRFYGADNVVDQHSGLRMDIDSMSYEELLALEEQIGDVSTGLTEGFIQKNLKTALYDPQTTFSLLKEPSSERETCVVCQVKYMGKERMGILDCGHNYHADCIKQWLLVKNLCPVCKETALTTHSKDG